MLFRDIAARAAITAIWVYLWTLMAANLIRYPVSDFASVMFLLVWMAFSAMMVLLGVGYFILPWRKPRPSTGNHGTLQLD